jgi:hypothetical protein
MEDDKAGCDDNVTGLVLVKASVITDDTPMHSKL